MSSRRFLDESDAPPDVRAQTRGPSETQVKGFQDIAKEIGNRKLEALRLYEPLPFQDAFHRCTAKEAILQKGNRAGGSLAGFVEVARAVTGQDPYDKYPKRDGVVACLGFGEPHIGKVIYPYLFMSNASFRIIKDEVTGDWRAYKPWTDAHRAKETKPAPPLIPNRYIKTIAWNNRAKRIFDRIDLVTGWTIFAFNSSGDPNHAQGFDATLVHIDEDTDMDGWYDEMIARLSMAATKYDGCPGFLRWTAMPHAKNEDLVTLVQRAEDEASQENPSAVVIKASVFDNPYLPKAAIEQNIKIWAAQGDDVLRKRAYGELTSNSSLVYPGFNKYLHNVRKEEEPRLKVQEILAKNNWEPPADWCRYAVLDPGHNPCATTFYAVPPPSVGDHVVCYKEFYIQECDASKWAQKMATDTRGEVFQAFIIDAHGGRLRELGSGIHPREQYTSALKERGIRSVSTGHGFRDGSDNIKGRENALREWFNIRGDGTTKLLVDVERCPNFIREIGRFRKKIVKLNGRDMVDDDAVRRMCHAVETMEYAAADGLRYVQPPKSFGPTSWLKQVMAGRAHRQAKRDGKNQPAGKNTISLGPVSVS